MPYLRISRREFGLGAAAAAAGCATSTSAYVDTEIDALDEEIKSSIRLEYDLLAAAKKDAFLRRTEGALDFSALRPAPRASDEDATAEAIISRTGQYFIPDWVRESIDGLDTEYWKLGAAERVPPSWPSASNAPDYRHLTRFRPPPGRFELSAAVLDFLAMRNSFNIDRRAGFLLFGLRGCIANAADLGEWTSRLPAEAIFPDHVRFRCLIGAWRFDTDQIAVFRASTAPEAQQMFAALKTSGLGVSLLPTGLYHYRIGVHKAGSALRQEAAFINQQSTYLVLRSPDNLTFNPFDPFDVWTVGAGHNVHGAGRFVTRPAFSSAGCPVVEGGYDATDRTISIGPWRTLRQMLGVADADGRAIPSASGTPLQFMLLTGLEAALASRADADFAMRYRPLRPGSSGEAVTALQERLFAQPDSVGRVTGTFDVATGFAALIDSFAADGQYSSPIVSAA